MTRRDIEDAPRDALTQPYAHWLAYHSTGCPRCHGTARACAVDLAAGEAHEFNGATAVRR